MDWVAAARRTDPATVEGRMWAALQRLVAARRATRAVHAHGAVIPVDTSNGSVAGILRAHAGERLLLLANVSELSQGVGLDVARAHEVAVTAQASEPDGRPLVLEGDTLVLAPYAFAWLRGG
jgi:amylosucrase